MKFIRNLKIRAKLLLVDLPLAFYLVSAIIFGYKSFNKVESELTRVYRNSLYEVNNWQKPSVTSKTDNRYSKKKKRRIQSVAFFMP